MSTNVVLFVARRAMKLKCLNAETPDKYGHYREAKFSQIKHHWFWKVRFWSIVSALLEL